MLAAGVMGLSAELLKRVYQNGAGAVVTKSIGPRARTGHSNPTVVSLDCGFLNAMGLPNPGADYFSNEVAMLKLENVTVVASVFADTLEGYGHVASRLAKAGADAVEVNCSCPNVEEVGLLGEDPRAVEEVTRIVKSSVKVPVLTKLTPSVTDIVEIARAAERGGADAITATNTLKGIAIDVETQRPILSNITGGLSGPALKPVALRCVWDIFENVSIPVVGCGGISGWTDAIEFFLCGASAVQVGTAIISLDLNIFNMINEGIANYLSKKGFRSVGEIVGKAHRR